MTTVVDKNHNQVTKEIDLTINRASSSIEANETVADYGEPTTIEVNSENATGVVYEIVDGDGNVVASGTVEEGTLIVPELGAGNYTVRLTTVVDKNHNSTTKEIGLTVNPVSPSIDVGVNNITYGDDEIITVTLPKDADGNVTITVDGIEYEVPIKNGVAKLSIPDLTAGNHTVKVHYSGDNNYNPIDSSATVNVAKIIPVITIEAVDILHGEVEVLNITVTAPGSVNVTVNGVTETLELDGESKGKLFSTFLNVLGVNHKATWNLYNLPVGQYPVYAVYNGDDNYQIVANSTSFKVSAVQSSINASAPNIKLGEDATITVNVSPKDATGDVTVVIDGKKYIGQVKNGKVVITVPNLSEGVITAKVYYSGDDNHTSSETKVSFRVGRMPSKVLPSGANIHVGDDETITVTVPKDATGKVTVTLNGKHYSSEVSNGKAVFKVRGLKAGKYDILAAYGGDDTYLPSNGTTSFKVSKVKPSVDIYSPQVKITEDGKVTVSLPNDATGTVTIEVGGKKYTASVKNGVAVFNIPGLDLGKHKIKVYYSGDDKYAANKAVTKIVVYDNNGNNDETHDGAHEKGSHDSSGGNDKSLSAYATGNPILVLLIMILAIGTTQLRRFKK